MASLFLDVHPSKAELTIFLYGNCVLTASNVSGYSFWYMLLWVQADGSTACYALHYETVVALDLRSCFIEYEPIHIVTWGSNCACLGEILQVESPLRPVWSIVSINYINIDYIELMNIKFLGEIDIVIPQLPCLCSIANAVSSMVVFVNSDTSNSISSLTLQCVLWPWSVSPLSWFHVLMTGTELDDKEYKWCQGCRSPHFCSASTIATKMHVFNFSKQQDILSPHSKTPTMYQLRFRNHGCSNHN